MTGARKDPNVKTASSLTGPRYERRDVAVRPISFALAGLVGLVVLAGGLVAALLALLPDPVSHPPLSALETQHDAPPPPRLQVHPAADDARVAAQAAARLQGYGWIDKDDVHIPIERAMQILVTQGWPDAKKAPSP